MDEGRLDFYIFPVALDKFRPFSLINFDLYIKVENRFVLYKHRNITITKDDIHTLQENNVLYLYVQNKERKSFRQYAENNIEEILKDPTVSLNVKATYIYESAFNVVEDIFKEPRSEGNIQRARGIINHTVDFIFSDSGAFVNLLQIRAHDYYTYTHSVNVCTFSVALANRIGITNPTTLKEVGLGALLHDVGKSKIDSRIINKPSALSPSEWEEMKKHPLYGVEIVQGTEAGGETVFSVISQHHEKVDGSGYPQGLKEHQLSIYGKISSICDVYDAITTNRSYSVARTPMEAAQFMLSRKENFDPTLLKHFFELFAFKKTTPP